MGVGVEGDVGDRHGVHRRTRPRRRDALPSPRARHGRLPAWPAVGRAVPPTSRHAGSSGARRRCWARGCIARRTSIAGCAPGRAVPAGRKREPSARYHKIALDSARQVPSSSCSSGIRPFGLRARKSAVRVSPVMDVELDPLVGQAEMGHQQARFVAIAGEMVVVQAEHGRSRGRSRPMCGPFAAGGGAGVIARSTAPAQPDHCRAPFRAAPTGAPP